MLQKIIIMVLLLIGIMGTIFYFPCKFDNRKTCLCHSIYKEETSEIVMEDNTCENACALMKIYLIPYGFLWWASLALLFSSVYYLKNNKKM